MLNIIAVFFGGGAGAVLRYLTGLLFLKIFNVNFPLATLCVNIAGCFILGFLYVFFVNKTDCNSALKLALTAGFCGGLTTFSTFSLEIFEMIKNANYTSAAVYVILSLVIGIVAVSIGATYAKLWI